MLAYQSRTLLKEMDLFFIGNLKLSYFLCFEQKGLQICLYVLFFLYKKCKVCQYLLPTC